MNINQKPVKLTKEGLLQLKEEYKELTEVKRPHVIDRLENARQQGDLSENSDYANAKDELEFLDGRIAELEDVLKNAEVVSTSNGKSHAVDLGTKVTLKVGGSQHVYDVVGEWEADPVNKKISPSSPLGEALIGKKVGDEAEVEAPAGKIIYKILKIE